ncbi:ribosomal protein L10 [Desulfofarcimen acetoxidans DSM 771]|uniref:Large ribosomal subunit protein uL10 n=1 Tax=Desulfofarcimen acetoxidans (strain ATCC 49208 / DSM 771 / KCTC 5769 / VKM B-1644 / 5575) TaxID=485916 RepID=C8W3X5_DESAS|nr:50S ribosomal protein L10 [Desulfofarcimen acetoxidans]ACV61229.1 ribosomal protein L10 [Desulfofarcimen acetoxidans DSM 771]
MPTKKEKEIFVEVVYDKMRSCKSAILADYRGLTVSAVTELRNKLRESNSDLKVAKNTLIKIAVDKIGIEGLDPYLEGPTAIAFGYDDPVAPAKILSEFARTNKDLEIKGGVLEGRVITADGVKGLASLPSREVLLGKVLGGMQAPLYGFANVLQGNIRNFVYVLEAVRKQKAGEA